MKSESSRTGSASIRKRSRTVSDCVQLSLTRFDCLTACLSTHFWCLLWKIMYCKWCKSKPQIRAGEIIQNANKQKKERKDLKRWRRWRRILRKIIRIKKSVVFFRLAHFNFAYIDNKMTVTRIEWIKYWLQIEQIKWSHLGK